MSTAVAQRLGQQLADSAFAETAELRKQTPGRRNQYGEWIPGDPTSATVTVVTAPVSGRERLLLPEGLRSKDLRTFYLREAVEAVLEGKTGQAADILVYGGREWHARMLKDWGGFFEVTAERV